MSGPARWVQPQLPFGRDEVGAAWTPPHIGHPSSTAYSHYGCRCPLCKEWRRSYDSDYWELVRSKREKGKKRWVPS